MKINKLLFEIKSLNSEYKVLKKNIKNHNLISSELNKYLKNDKESFKNLWQKYIYFLDKLKYLIKKSKYRNYFIFINYDKLVIRRYLVIFYYNILVDLIKVFGKHDKFIRVFLYENFKKDYSYYAKFIYKIKYANLINTPNILFQAFKNKVDKSLFFMLESENISIKKINRAFTDYKNIYFYIKRFIDEIILFFSKRVGFIIARIRFSTRKKGLISKKHLNKYLGVAKPGDILLTRGNWNASNISIPGFWKHMSMYIGTGKFLKKSFKFKFINDLEDNSEYIIEATGDGIQIVKIKELAFKNDYLGVSRTNFKKEKILRVIKSSLTNIGKGYDFIFNFYSDKNLVCSELVLKSYAKDFKKDEGINIELENIGISLVYPPNNFIQILLNEQKRKTHKVFPIVFIDSIEKTHKNFINTNNNFLESGSRSRFSLFLK